MSLKDGGFVGWGIILGCAGFGLLLQIIFGKELGSKISSALFIGALLIISACMYGIVLSGVLIWVFGIPFRDGWWYGILIMLGIAILQAIRGK